VVYVCVVCGVCVWCGVAGITYVAVTQTAAYSDVCGFRRVYIISEFSSTSQNASFCLDYRDERLGAIYAAVVSSHVIVCPR